MTGAYYNEHDPFAAEWLRALILFGHVAPGDVDERSIEDVTPDDLRGYTQVHAFAGIGIWSAALRMGGWPDDRPIWTGSCPCQPFSAAGKGAGFADERHLWPAWHWLVGQCRPDTIFGEQVEGPAGDRWFDLVSTDLEGEGYACGQSVFPAAGVGAPHIRHRRYWLAHSEGDGRIERRAEPDGRSLERGSRLVLSSGTGSGRDARAANSPLCQSQSEGHSDWQHEAIWASPAGGLVEPESQQEGFSRRSRLAGGSGGLAGASGYECTVRDGEPHGRAEIEPSGLRSPWSDPDWIWCRDGKYRPVESGSFPLAAGASGRVGRLRGYGNALCLPAAQAFVEAAMTCL